MRPARVLRCPQHDKPVFLVDTDKTGVTGNYDLSIAWKTGENQAEEVSVVLQDRLGLKLERQMTPEEMIVIELVMTPQGR